MPGKHVRFADQDVYHSWAPLTPSPTFSDSSLPSVSTPMASYSPPSLYSPLGPVRIHTALGVSARPSFAWDITQHPASSHTPLPTHILSEPATNPPLPSLTIVSNILPWSITVKPYSPSTSPHKPIHWAPTTSYVTVADVLSCLYRALRLSILPAEYNQLPSHDARHIVNRAYHTRTHGNEEDARKGVRRVDFLGQRKTFLGFSSTPTGPDVWMLNVT